MLNIYCSLHESGEPLNGYNAPYRYSIAKRLNLDYVQSLNVWELSCEWVIDDFVSRVMKVVDKNSQFAFATPPSRTQIFTQKIRLGLRNSFPKAVDISHCFFKSKSFSAVSTRRKLSNHELLTFFSLNQECFERSLPHGTTKVLLADDVYSWGNTFNAMTKLINNAKPEIEIITAVILKTEL